MSSKSKSAFWNGFVFVLFFILPQVIVFTQSTYNPTNPFWLLYLIVVAAFMFIRRSYWDESMRNPYFFFLSICFGVLMSTLEGLPIGGVLSRITIAAVAFWGYAYFSHNRISPDVFIILLPLLYCFFYLTYFRYDVIYRLSVNGNLYGESSSNTIPIILNCVWLYYYIITITNKKIEVKRYHYWGLLLFSAINLFLIIIQGSRAGITVAAIDLLLVVSRMTKFSNQAFIILFVAMIIAFMYFAEDYLSSIMEVDKMQGWASLEDNNRGVAQVSFFAKMNLERFILGYPPNSVFGDNNRTFNAFLDFWANFGLLPLTVLVFFLLRRLFKWKHYSLSLLTFAPVLFYSLVESFWGGSFLDILIYILLFYSYDKDTSKTSFSFQTNTKGMVS